MLRQSEYRLEIKESFTNTGGNLKSISYEDIERNDPIQSF